MFSGPWSRSGSRGVPLRDRGNRRDGFVEIRGAELPMKQPVMTWGGTATKTTCAVCDITIEAVSEIEADCADGRTRLYYPRCYRLVVVEREFIRSVRETNVKSLANHDALAFIQRVNPGHCDRVLPRRLIALHFVSLVRLFHRTPNRPAQRRGHTPRL